MHCQYEWLRLTWIKGAEGTILVWRFARGINSIWSFLRTSYPQNLKLHSSHKLDIPVCQYRLLRLCHPCSMSLTQRLLESLLVVKLLFVFQGMSPQSIKIWGQWPQLRVFPSKSYSISFKTFRALLSSRPSFSSKMKSWECLSSLQFSIRRFGAQQRYFYAYLALKVRLLNHLGLGKFVRNFQSF